MSAVTRNTCIRIVVDGFQSYIPKKNANEMDVSNGRKASGAAAAQAYWPEFLKNILSKIFPEKYGQLNVEKKDFSDALYCSLYGRGFFSQGASLGGSLFDIANVSDPYSFLVNDELWKWQVSFEQGGCFSSDSYYMTIISPDNESFVFQLKSG